MKLLKTANTEIVKYCQEQFSFKSPNELILRLYFGINISTLTIGLGYDSRIRILPNSF